MRLLSCLFMTGLLVAVEAPSPEVATPADGDHRVGIYAREHVQIELYAPMGAAEARAVLSNRRDASVLVHFTVEASMGEPRTYEIDLQAKETRGADGRFVIPIGEQLRPRIAITQVDILPIEEASGYVRLAEENRERVTITLYRAETGGDRVYAVLVNNDDRAVTVSWQASGLVVGEPLRFTTDIAARSVIGRGGRIVLPYKPIHDPRFRTRPRVHISGIAPRAR